jgi:septal ring factor EnvC (AmiA/AmiB activator)
MSSFSKTLIHPALVFITLLFVSLETSFNPAIGSDQDQIKEIESRLLRQKEKLEAVHFQEKDILAYLSDLEQEVAEKRRVVYELGNKIRLAKKEIKKLEARSADLEQSLQDIEMQMAERLIALYKYARKGYLRILANASDLDQFCQRTKYFNVVMEEDRKVLVGLTQKERKHKKDILLIREQLGKIRALEEEEKMRLVPLREDLEKKVIHLMKIHKEKEFYETAVKELQIAAENLKQAFLKIEQKKTYKAMHSSRFGDSKGKLPYPLEGKALRGDKLLGSERLNLHKGIYVTGSSDSEVKAVFPGRVDFSGRLKGYGEVIIINHGSRYFTISAHLSRRIKEEGDMVEEGEVIGSAGINAYLEEPGVYFEMRRGGKHLNPMKWLKSR